MKEFGAALKQAREESGLTLENIHDRTRIHLKHLRAIENGDFPSVPPTYVRAFIREYARMIGLDEDATVAEYNRLAEELKGIPRPPEALDHSHLTPKIDDSVEIVEAPPPGAASPGTAPRHVEVEGTMEIDEQEFTLPVRRSKYVSDDHKSVELPSSSQKKPEEPPTENPQQESLLPFPTELAKEQAQAPETQAETPKQEKSKASPPPPAKQDAPPRTASPEAAPPPPRQTEQRPEPPNPVTPEKLSPPAKQPERAAAQAAQSAQAAQPPSDQAKPSLAERVSFLRKPRQQTAVAKETAPAPKPKKRTSEDEEQRRLLMIGSLITLAIIIGIYGIVYFSDDTTPSIATADSTQVQTNIYADRFIDSTDFIPDEPEILPDTTTGAVQAPTADQTRNENLYSSEDSLILEAFSSTPVYFSIRMDTTKTEKGFLSKNEHRVWKAKDRFVISLGDAGAMTFFLNGKQLRSLGGEGLAINNFVINRKTIDQE